jgi:hypothetical protein
MGGNNPNPTYRAISVVPIGSRSCGNGTHPQTTTVSASCQRIAAVK